MMAIDNFLNSITMYRLALYALFILALVAIVFGFSGFVPFSGLALLVSLATLLAAAWVANTVFAKIFSAPTNPESPFITALILFFIFAPGGRVGELSLLALAAAIAMASKFLVAPKRRHVFNPAACSAFVMYLFGLSAAAWWVVVPSLLPIALVLGFLVVRKLRRAQMFFSFLGAAVVAIFFFNLDSLSEAPKLFGQVFTLWPTIFFGTIMLTEPLTAPGRKKWQIVYGVIVGLLFGSQFQIGPLVPAPEFVLLVGNLFAYFVSFKRRLTLRLKEKIKVAQDIYEFVFIPDGRLAFVPGQYLEWSLPHTRPDLRGARRYFTIASSPTETEIKLGVKFYQPSSTFKQALLGLAKEKKVLAHGLAGDFVLPQNKNEKLVFIAGGIGVTPFRSMIKYLLDRKETRDITLLYCVKSEADVAYRDIFLTAERVVGLKTYYIIDTKLDSEIIKNKIPDWRVRKFYISGPDPMVRAFKKKFLHMGISRRHILTDYFPGYA